MDSDMDGRSARYRHMPPPIALDEVIESVDVATHPDLQDDAYREQEWLIRNAPG